MFTEEEGSKTPAEGLITAGSSEELTPTAGSVAKILQQTDEMDSEKPPEADYFYPQF